MAQIAAPTVEVVDQKGNALLLRVHTTIGYTPTYRHFLVGQDSNNMADPFITQVFRKIKTVEEAFESLVPLAVKEARARGLQVKRQGDWFFVPSPPPQGSSCHLALLKLQEKRPALPPFQYGALYHQYYVNGPTRHTVRPWPGLGIPEGTQVVYRENGRHYVRGIVEAPDHEPLYLEDWHIAHRANSGPWGRPENRGRPGGD